MVWGGGRWMSGFAIPFIVEDKHSAANAKQSDKPPSRDVRGRCIPQSSSFAAGSAIFVAACSMFHLIVTISARTPADVAPVADALARMRPLCLAEPGCVHWEAYQSLDAPDKFVLVEHWKTREHWEAHGQLGAITDIYMPEVFPRIEREVHPSVPLGHLA